MDSSTDAIGGWTKNTPKPASYQYNRLISQYNRLMSLYNRLTETGPQNQQKKTLIFARQFLTIFKQKCSNMRPLLSITFSQGFRISKNIWHLTSGSGGKKTVKRYLKSEQTNTRTDRQTDRQTDRRTNRLIDWIGPEGRFSESLWPPDQPTDRQTRNEKPLHGRPFLGPAFFLCNFCLRLNCH